MRRFRSLLIGTFLLAMLGGLALVGPSTSLAMRAQDQSYWRYHGGRWSHWDAGDRRWYYTDGSHWYWHNGKAWEPYRFDRGFGKGFERGKYEVLGPGVKVVVPAHEVYVH